MGMKSGAKMKRATTATVMQIIHKKTISPLMIPTHAIERPDSFRLLVLLKEITPDTSARIASRKLIG